MKNSGRGMLLVVDEDSAMRAMLSCVFVNSGFGVLEAACGEDALDIVRSTNINGVVLDVKMPGLDGIETCRRIRSEEPTLAILMLSGRGDEEYKIQAFDAGADDFIAKPFHVGELMARIRAMLRWSMESDERNGMIALGGFVLDREHLCVTKRGETIRLTPTQCEVLHYLMANQDKPIPHKELLTSVWGAGYAHQVEYLRTFIRQIRVRIEDDPSRPKCLLTEPHFGYRFNGCSKS